MAVPVLVSGDTQTNEVTSTSVALTAPSGLADGDVLYAYLSKDGAVAITPASGFTELDDIRNSTVHQLVTFRKVITDASGEPGTYTWSWTGSVRAVAGLVRITGADNTTPEDVAPSTNTGFAITPSCASITTVTDDVLLLAIGGEESQDSWTAPSGMTEETDHAQGGGPSSGRATASLAQEDIPTAEVTGTRNFVTSGNGNDEWCASLIGVRPLVEPSLVWTPRPLASIIVR